MQKNLIKLIENISIQEIEKCLIKNKEITFCFYNKNKKINYFFDILHEIINREFIYNFLKQLLYYDKYTFIHSIDVGIYSLYFAYTQGYANSLLFDIGIAGFIHDSGKLYIPLEILNKPNKLNDKEYMFIQQHPYLSYFYLKENEKELQNNKIISECILKHHLLQDHSGYPNLQAFSSNQYTQIISICDVFDALNSKRAYKEGYSKEICIEIMKSEFSNKFDKELLNDFFQII